MYKMIIGLLFIVSIIFIMVFTGVYINYSASSDLHDNIDITSSVGYRANLTMQNMSRTFDTSTTALSMLGFVMAVTCPLAAIVIIRRIL